MCKDKKMTTIYSIPGPAMSLSITKSMYVHIAELEHTLNNDSLPLSKKAISSSQVENSINDGQTQISESLAARQHHQMQVHTSHNVLCIHGVCFITGGCMLFISRR